MSVNIHVLMIEDNLGDVELVKALLEEEAGDGFSVSLKIIMDGKEAIDYINSATSKEISKLDLIMMDLNLPNFSGQEILTVIKEHGAFSQIPIIIMSEMDYAKKVLSEFNLPEHCYIQKPILLSHMLKAINFYTWALIPNSKNNHGNRPLQR